MNIKQLSRWFLDNLERHWFPISVIALLAFIGISPLELATLRSVFLAGMSVVFLSNVSTYSFTRIEIDYDSPQTLGFIFLGCSLLVGLVWFGTLFTLIPTVIRP